MKCLAFDRPIGGWTQFGMSLDPSFDTDLRRKSEMTIVWHRQKHQQFRCSDRRQKLTFRQHDRGRFGFWGP